jgi:hypothetical protein
VLIGFVRGTAGFFELCGDFYYLILLINASLISFQSHGFRNVGFYRPGSIISVVSVLGEARSGNDWLCFNRFNWEKNLLPRIAFPLDRVFLSPKIVFSNSIGGR